jgi:hypothetical protein
MPDLQLIRTDILKLRKRWGMVALAIVMTTGAMIVGYVVMAIQHASDPSKHGPAGGLHNYQGSAQFLAVMAFVAATIVGSTAGAADLESGVFRDLAATGRPRLALFSSRILGAWGVIVPIAALAALIPAVASIALAGSLAAPGAAAIVAGTASVLVSAMLGAAVSVGLAALVGSRGPVIAIMLGFNLAVAQLLVTLSFLGDARNALPGVAIDRIGHVVDKGLSPTLTTAILVVLAWLGAAYAAGAWRTRTREI